MTDAEKQAAYARQRVEYGAWLTGEYHWEPSEENSELVLYKHQAEGPRATARWTDVPNDDPEPVRFFYSVEQPPKGEVYIISSDNLILMEKLARDTLDPRPGSEPSMRGQP